jgi:hypothetical protein
MQFPTQKIVDIADKTVKAFNMGSHQLNRIESEVHKTG